LKGKTGQDLLGEKEETSKNAHPGKAAHCDYDDKPEYDDNSNAGDGLRSDDDVLFDFEDDGSNDGTADKDIDEHGSSDSSYNSDGTDVIITKDTDKCYTTELNESKEPL
jgi:hypothetical protein